MPKIISSSIPQGNYTSSFNPSFKVRGRIPTPPKKKKDADDDLPRSIFFHADVGGCGFWRMIWPAEHLLSYKKAKVTLTQMMYLDPNIFRHIQCVRLQRQLSRHQLEYVKFLKKTQERMLMKTGNTFRILWEVDDIVHPVDYIPNFNLKKYDFLRKNGNKDFVKEIVELCDEVTVVSPYMKEHYKKYLDYDKISVIPNYVPRNWADGFYDRDKCLARREQQDKRPRILYNGSGTHFDIGNKDGQKDDFFHVVKYIRKTKDKYKWVFFGGHPSTLKDLVDSGEVEYHPWTPLFDYPRKISELNTIMSVAPLRDIPFNRAKSSLKLYEGGAQGLPCIAQNIDCYNLEGQHLFHTAEELEYNIQNVLQNYEECSDNARKLAEGFWLNDHLDQYTLLMKTDWGDPQRSKNDAFIKNNLDQSSP